MDYLLLALDVIHGESGKLKEKRKKGEEIEWKDVKPLLKALGSLAGNEEIVAEAKKKGPWYVAGLKMFSGAMKNL